MMNRLLCAAFLFSLVAACSSGSGDVPSTSGGASSSGGGPGALQGVATSESQPPPAGSKVALLWQVTSGSPDYMYSQNAGTADADKAAVNASVPPADALNAGKLGIAFVTVFKAETTLADGKINEDTYESAALSISPDYAVIYRATTETVLKNGWDANFPQGYSCGKCQRAEKGFDNFVPVSCSEIKLVPVSSKPKVCNWT